MKVRSSLVDSLRDLQITCWMSELRCHRRLRRSGLLSRSLEALAGEAEESHPEDLGVPGDPLPQ